MEQATKIQTSTPFEGVPHLCMELVEKKVCRELEIIHCEVDHLMRLCRHDSVPNMENVVWHLDQARRRLFTLDVYLQDAHSLAANYIDYKTAKAEELDTALGKLQETVGNLADLNGGEKNEHISEE